MLAYLLALIVGLSSLALYLAAFFFPEVHRKNDFLWSGLGFFYALVLWVCAGRITGGVLLGQTASVTLLGWLGWQTLALRRQLAPVDQQTAVPTAAEWQAALAKAWDGLSKSDTIAPLMKPLNRQATRLIAWLEALVTTTTKPTSTPLTDTEPQPYVPLTPADFANAKRAAAEPTETIAADVTPVTVTPAATPAAVSPAAVSPATVSPATVSPATVSPATTNHRAQPRENPLTAIASSFKGLTAKRESKPVYVRKQFRAPDAAAPASEAAIADPKTVDTKTIDTKTAVIDTQTPDQPEPKHMSAEINPAETTPAETIPVEPQAESAAIDSVEAAIVDVMTTDAETTDTKTMDTEIMDTPSPSTPDTKHLPSTEPSS